MHTRTCFFVSDLHGHVDRYQKLFNAIEQEYPFAVFMGGDLLPSGLFQISAMHKVHDDFMKEVLRAGFSRLREGLSVIHIKIINHNKFHVRGEKYDKSRNTPICH